MNTDNIKYIKGNYHAKKPLNFSKIFELYQRTIVQKTKKRQKSNTLSLWHGIYTIFASISIILMYLESTTQNSLY